MKPYKCTYVGCDKSFTANSSLQIHARIHNSISTKKEAVTDLSMEQDLNCPIITCEYISIDRSDLSNHLVSEHKNLFSRLNFNALYARSSSSSVNHKSFNNQSTKSSGNDHLNEDLSIKNALVSPFESSNDEVR